MAAKALEQLKKALDGVMGPAEEVARSLSKIEGSLVALAGSGGALEGSLAAVAGASERVRAGLDSLAGALAKAGGGGGGGEKKKEDDSKPLFGMKGAEKVGQSFHALTGTLNAFDSLRDEVIRETLADIQQTSQALGQLGREAAAASFGDIGASLKEIAQIDVRDLPERLGEVGSTLWGIGQMDVADLGSRFRDFGGALFELGAIGAEEIGGSLQTLGSSLTTLREIGLDDIKAKFSGFFETVKKFGAGTLGGLYDSILDTGKALEHLDKLELGKLSSAFTTLKTSAETFRVDGLAAARASAEHFKTALENLRGEGVFTRLKDGVSELRSGLDSLGSGEGLGKIRSGFAELREALSKVGSEGFEALKKSASSFREIAGESFTAARQNFSGFATALGSTGQAASGFMQILPALGKGLEAVKGAFAALSTTLLANPIGIVIAALAALVAAYVLFEDKTVQIGNTQAAVGDWIQATWEETKKLVIEKWEQISKWWAENGFSITEVWDIIRDTIVGSFTDLREAAGAVLGWLGEHFGGFGELVAVIFSKVFEFIKDSINRIIGSFAAIPEAFAAVKDAILSGNFEGLWGRLDAIAKENLNRDFVGEVFGNFAAGIESFVTEVKDLVVQTGVNIRDDFVEFGQNVAQRAAELTRARPPAPPSPPAAGGAGAGGAGPVKICEEASGDPCAEKVRQLEEALEAAREAASAATAALSEMTEAPIEELDEKATAFETALTALSEALTTARERLSGLSEDSEQYKTALAEIEALEAEHNQLLEKGKGFLSKYSTEVREASRILGQFAKAEDQALKDELAQQFQTAMDRVGEAIAEARIEVERLKAAGEPFDAAQTNLDQLVAAYDQLRGRAAELGLSLDGSNQQVKDGTADTTADLTGIWDGFLDNVQSSFWTAFDQLLDGNTDAFKDFFGTVKDLFKQFLKDLAKEAIKNAIKIPLQIGDTKGGNGTPAAGVEIGGASGRAQQASQKLNFNQLLNAVGLGYGVGSIVGSFLAKEDNYAQEAGQILGVVGAVIGAFYGSPEVGALIGSVVGSLIGSLIKRGLPQAQATITAVDGKAIATNFYTKNKGKLEQIRQYADEVVKGINNLAGLTGATLIDLPEIKLDIKNNKYFRVIDASGFVHKFGEDYKAAMNYAILTAIKNANFEGLAPEVEAAIKNSQATTAEELASDIEFAKEVADIDLAPTTKELRDIIREFNSMRQRAQELGISLEKVDRAFNNSIEEMKDNILSGLDSFKQMGLTDVEREALRITEAFAEMRENARLFNEELTREKDARNDEIAALQDQLAEQERLQELYDQLAANQPELPEGPEIDSELGLRPGGRQRPDFEQLAEQAGEAVASLMAEIARLFELNAQQTLIDMEEIAAAEQAARAALRQRVRDSLKPYLYLDLSPVEQQLAQLSDTFDKLRRDARAAGVPMHEVNAAYAAARRQIERQFDDLLRPFQDIAEGITPLEADLRELREQFDELRAGAEALGRSVEEIDELEAAAVANLQEQLRDQLRSFTDSGLPSMVVELRDLAETFEELRRSAEALGVSSEEVDAAWQAALEAQQRQLQEGLQSFLDYGQGLSDLAVRHRDLGLFFAEQAEAARALDAAMGHTGPEPGANEQLVREAEAAAFQQLVDEFIASLADLRDAGLSPTEQALRDIRDRFTQLRSDAELLGLSVEELSRLERQAVEALWDDLQGQLDQYLLSDEERQQQSLEEEFLGYLTDALALGTYEPGSGFEEPEPFPGARLLEEDFTSLGTAAQELALVFRELQGVAIGEAPHGEPGDPILIGSGAGAPGALSPAELLARVFDALPGLRAAGDTFEGLDDEAAAGIDAAATQLTQLLLQLQLGLTDNIPGIEDALTELITRLQDSGLDVSDSLLALADTLATGDIDAFLEGLSDSILGTSQSFGDLLAVLLEDMSLPELMRQLADGTFDAIMAMLGVTELPQELMDMLQQIGEAYFAAEEQQRRPQNYGSSSSASSAAEQREREKESLEAQLRRFEELALSRTARELAHLDEQFEELRESARRLGVPLERVEAAYQLALEDLRKGVRDQLESFTDLGLSPVARELKHLHEQFDELRESAQLLGIPLSEVDAAWEAALEQQRQGVYDQLKPYEELGLSPVARELARLDEQFAELRESAELLGIPLERVDAAYEAAIEEQRRLLREQLRPFNELDLSPAEAELLHLEEQFEDMRETAELLGMDLAEVDEAYAKAIEDFWDRVLDPIRELNESLALSDLSTLTPEERLAEAQARFDELKQRALAGDFEAIEQLPGAAQALLQEARGFYASGQGYQTIFDDVQAILDSILALAPTGGGDAPPAPEPAGGDAFAALLAALEAGGGSLEALLAQAQLPGLEALLASDPAEILGGILARPLPFVEAPDDVSDSGAWRPFLPYLPQPGPGPGTEGRPVLAVDVRRPEGEQRELVEELKRARFQGHADQLELQKKIEAQGAELKELRALMRRVTNRMEFGSQAG